MKNFYAARQLNASTILASADPVERRAADEDDTDWEGFDVYEERVDRAWAKQERLRLHRRAARAVYQG